MRSFTHPKTGKQITISSNKKLVSWEARAAFTAFAENEGEAPRLQGYQPGVMEVWVWLLRPKGHYALKGRGVKTIQKTDKWRPYPTSKNDGDSDKYIRAAGDALTNIVYDDDSQIVDTHIYKRYCDSVADEGMRILVRRWESEDVGSRENV